jgi:tyrosyl-tRNA synthetase
MGKSLGNYIGVAESADEMFGKTMSIPDTLMREWFELLTDRGEAEIGRLTDPVVTKPRDAKEILAKDIVAFYHGAAAADAAAVEFVRRFREHQDPTDIAEVSVPAAELLDGKVWVCKLLTLAGLATSNNEARRAVEAGSVNFGAGREIVTDPKTNVPVVDGLVVRNGKKKIVRLRLR